MIGRRHSSVLLDLLSYGTISLWHTKCQPGAAENQSEGLIDGGIHTEVQSERIPTLARLRNSLAVISCRRRKVSRCSDHEEQ
jgi:hypothetical protein